MKDKKGSLVVFIVILLFIGFFTAWLSYAVITGQATGVLEDIYDKFAEDKKKCIENCIDEKCPDFNYTCLNKNIDECSEDCCIEIARES